MAAGVFWRPCFTRGRTCGGPRWPPAFPPGRVSQLFQSHKWTQFLCAKDLGERHQREYRTSEFAWPPCHRPKLDGFGYYRSVVLLAGAGERRHSSRAGPDEYTHGTEDRPETIL